MGGQSFHTKIEHQKVWDLYLEKIQKDGIRASRITRSTYHEEISEETGYAVVTVRTIINKFAKRKSCPTSTRTY